MSNEKYMGYFILFSSTEKQPGQSTPNGYDRELRYRNLT